MSEIGHNGGPAFPITQTNPRNGVILEHWPGMSLRDWFAGQALTAALTLSPPVLPEQIAAVAYAIADAMMVVRNEVKP